MFSSSSNTIAARITRWAVRRLLFTPLVVVVVCWVASYFVSAGVGLGRSGAVAGAVWGPGASGAHSTIGEISLIRGGVLLVIDGTRTDSIAFESEPMGSGTLGWPVYAVVMDGPQGAAGLLPRMWRPATWSGPYVIVPWWMAAIPAACLAWVGTRVRRRAAAGLCEKCGYDRAGLGSGVRCPECGEKAEMAHKKNAP